MAKGNKRRTFRASATDRENYRQVLSQAYAEGRLDDESLEIRNDKLARAKTIDELDLLIADLPVPDWKNSSIQSPGRPPNADRRKILSVLGGGAIGLSAFWGIRYLVASPTKEAPAPPSPKPKPTLPSKEATVPPPPKPKPTTSLVVTIPEPPELVHRVCNWLKANGHTTIYRIRLDYDDNPPMVRVEASKGSPPIYEVSLTSNAEVQVDHIDKYGDPFQKGKPIQWFSTIDFDAVKKASEKKNASGKVTAILARPDRVEVSFVRGPTLYWDPKTMKPLHN